MVNKLEPSFKLNEEIFGENFDSQTERAISDIIQELQSDSDYSLSASSQKDMQWVVQNIMDAFQNDNLDQKKVQDYVLKYFQGEEKEMIRPQRGPNASQQNSEALKKFIYIDQLLGDAMSEEQATKLMDDIRNELSIEEIQILKDNVSGPLYSHLSEYDGEMGGLSRY